MSLTVEDILRGTKSASRQSVGNMEVIPLVSDEDDETFAPPDFYASTREYGQIRVRNDSDRPSIVPPGAGWVVEQSAQDHAVCSGALMPAKKTRSLTKACCIQETQGGLISETQGSMLILPASIRSQALAIRNDTSYNRLWDVIRKFKRSVGLDGSGNLVDFLKAFRRQLDEFVAEFELIPRQVGAVVLINGTVVGVERAPSTQFWRTLWNPLIRVCYGSLAIQNKCERPPVTRTMLKMGQKTLEGLREALTVVTEAEMATTARIVSETDSMQLQLHKIPDEKMGEFNLLTVANERLSGQIVRDKEMSVVKYASLCISGK